MRRARGWPGCAGSLFLPQTAGHGQEQVLQRGVRRPETVDGDPGLAEAAVDLGCLLTGRPCDQRDGQPVLGEGDAGSDRGLAEGAYRRGRIRALNLDGDAGPSDQLADGTLADDLAMVDDGYLVAGAFHLIEQVRGQHD